MSFSWFSSWVSFSICLFHFVVILMSFLSLIRSLIKGELTALHIMLAQLLWYSLHKPHALLHIYVLNGIHTSASFSKDPRHKSTYIRWWLYLMRFYMNSTPHSIKGRSLYISTILYRSQNIMNFVLVRTCQAVS